MESPHSKVAFDNRNGKAPLAKSPLESPSVSNASHQESATSAPLVPFEPSELPSEHSIKVPTDSSLSAKCDLEHLRLYLAGGLKDAADYQAMDEHLLGCDACATIASAMPGPQWVQDFVVAESTPNVTRHRLGDAYEIAEELGRGGAGIVYRAWQRPIGRWVALKMLIGGVAAQSKQLARFRREAAALAKLQHPQIVRILDSGEQDGVPYLAMELIDGPSLAAALTHHRPTPRQSAKIVAELARGVSSAHQNGIIHRDLKPHNVLLALAATHTRAQQSEANQEIRESQFRDINFDTVQPKLVDFGLSLVHDECFATQTGESLGTPAYVAPEMLNPQLGRVTEMADIYGLGTILYQCLYGRTPFVGSQQFELIEQVLKHEPSWETLTEAVPIDLRTICQKCLEKKPAARFQSAHELEQELNRFLQGIPIRSRAIGRLERAGRWCRRNPWPTAAALVLIASTLTIVSLLLVFQSSLIRQRDQAQRNYDDARAAIWEILDKSSRESAIEVPKLTEMQVAQLRPAMSFFERLVQVAKTDEARLDLARIRIRLASMLIARQELEEGEALLLQAIEQLRAMTSNTSLRDAVLIDAFSATTKYALSISYHDRGLESLKLVQPLVAQSQELCQRHPHDWSYRSHRAWILHNLACIQQHCGDLPAAQGSFEATIQERQLAYELHQQQFEQMPLNWELELAESYVSLATVELTLQQQSAAIEDFDRARELMRLAYERDPKNLRVLCSAAAVQLNLSNLYASQQQLPLAVAACERGVDLIEKVLNADPSSLDAREYGAMLYGNRALYKEEKIENLPLVIDDWRRASELFQSLDHRNYATLQWGRCLILANRWNEAIQSLESVKLRAEQTDLIVFELTLRAKLVDYLRSQNDVVDVAESATATTAHFASQVQWWQRQLELLNQQGFFANHPQHWKMLQEDADFAGVRQALGADYWATLQIK